MRMESWVSRRSWASPWLTVSPSYGLEVGEGAVVTIDRDILVLLALAIPFLTIKCWSGNTATVFVLWSASDTKALCLTPPPSFFPFETHRSWPLPGLTWWGGMSGLSMRSAILSEWGKYCSFEKKWEMFILWKVSLTPVRAPHRYCPGLSWGLRRLWPHLSGRSASCF